MNFETTAHRIGDWALNYLVNADASGLDEWELDAVKLWEANTTTSWIDADGNNWEFSHWSIGDFDDFARDDIRGLMGSAVTVFAHFALVTHQAPLSLS